MTMKDAVMAMLACTATAESVAMPLLATYLQYSKRGKDYLKIGKRREILA